MTLSRKGLTHNQNVLFELVEQMKRENRDRDAQLRSLGATVQEQADEIDALKSDLETANQALHSQRRLIADLEGRALPMLRPTNVGFEDLVPEPA